jgi:hypothetical protein
MAMKRILFDEMISTIIQKAVENGYHLANSAEGSTASRYGILV